jgi:hypothetical protein
MKHYLLLLLLAGSLHGCGDRNPGKHTSGSEQGTDPEVMAKQHTDSEYRDMGLQYAMAVQGTLGKTLQGKIREDGPMGAIEFCNVNALAITDSIGRSLGAEISRVTDRARNPLNQATMGEITLISEYRDELMSGDAPEPLVMHEGGKVYFYSPILTNDLCLKCHGTVESDISPEVFSKLRELYPGDQAVSYSANELRGLWKVTFPGE